MATQSTVLDALETRRNQSYAALVENEHDCTVFDQKVRALEGQTESLYKFALTQSKGDLSVREVFELWDKMVSICDSFIDHVRVMAEKSPCGVSFNRLLDVRLAAGEKREFHRCC